MFHLKWCIHPFGRRGVKFVLGWKISFVRIYAIFFLWFFPLLPIWRQHHHPSFLSLSVLFPLSFALERVHEIVTQQESLSVVSGTDFLLLQIQTEGQQLDPQQRINLQDIAYLLNRPDTPHATTPLYTPRTIICFNCHKRYSSKSHKFKPAVPATHFINTPTNKQTTTTWCSLSPM